MTQVWEDLPSKLKALSSAPSITQKTTLHLERNDNTLKVAIPPWFDGFWQVHLEGLSRTQRKVQKMYTWDLTREMQAVGTGSGYIYHPTEMTDA
jgi:hypothetical protein